MSFQFSPSTLLQEIQLKIQNKEQEIINLESQIQPVPEQTFNFVANQKIGVKFGAAIFGIKKTCANCNQIQTIEQTNSLLRQQRNQLRADISNLRNTERLLQQETQLEQRRISEQLTFQRETQFKIQEKQIQEQQSLLQQAKNKLDEIQKQTSEQPQEKPSNIPLIAGLGLIGVALLG